MLKQLRYSICVFALIFTSNSYAFFSPVSIGIVPPLQFPPSDFSITGARISAIYGRQRDVYGIDVGVLGNITEQEFVGLAVAGGFNWTKGYTTVVGAQLAGAANVNTQKTTVIGLQAAIGTNWNEAESSLTGVQLSLANLSPHMNIYGLQAGIYNNAQAVYGLQVGLVNTCKNLHGLQIGLVNFNDNGFFKVSPILNIGF